MQIMRSGTRPSREAPSDWFTGKVRMDPVVDAPAPARVNALQVTFEPGARTNWHTHPFGQTLFVLSGVGLVGLRDEAPKAIHPGDTVWIPEGIEHWHGAGPETGMCHMAIQERDGDSAATWLEPVSDADYLRKD